MLRYTNVLVQYEKVVVSSNRVRDPLERFGVCVAGSLVDTVSDYNIFVLNSRYHT